MSEQRQWSLDSTRRNIDALYEEMERGGKSLEPSDLEFVVQSNDKYLAGEIPSVEDMLRLDRIGAKLVPQ